MDWRKLVAIGIVGTLAFAATAGPFLYVATRPLPPPSPEGAAPTYREAAEVSVSALINGTRDALRVEFKGPPGVVAQLSVKDPAKEPRRTLAEWNASAGQAHVLDAATLPRLLVIQAQTTGEHAATLALWVWQGRAHVLTAKTPEGLATQLQGAFP
jgi:hypothetical protein